MRFVYRLEPRDYQALVEALGLRRRFGQPADWLWFALGAANLAFVGFWVLVAPPSTRATVLALLSGAFAVFAFAAPVLYRAHMRRMVHRHPASGHEVVTELADAAIVATYGDTVERFAYPAVLSVDERPEHLLLWIGRRRAIILPKRGLIGPASIEDVRLHIEERREAMTDIEARNGQHAFDDHPAVDLPDGHLKLSATQAASIRKDAFEEAERKDFDNALEGWYGRAPRTPPRMARERTLPPDAASDPKTDTV